MIVGGIGVSEIAADGGKVPHDRIGNHLRRVVNEWIPRPDQLRLLEIRLARERADAEEPLGFPDERQAGNPVDVNEVMRIGQTELHQRDEALPAR